MNYGDRVEVEIDGKVHVLVKRDVGPELESDRRHRRQLRGELDLLRRMSPLAKSLGFDAGDFPSDYLLRREDRDE